MSNPKEKTVKDTTATARRIPAKAVPLLVFASILSVASLGWTTYSLLDLLKVGAIGLTVAATADLIWSAVIWCEYKGIGPRGWVKTIGWIAVCVVGGFIAWHGAIKGIPAMAVAGPFLTLGTKVVWELALVSLKDPIKEKKETSAREIALLDAETDTILEKAEAEIRKEKAQMEADHRRVLAEKRRIHELKMADLAYESEENRAASAHRSEMLVDSIENSQFEKILGIIERQNEQQTIPGAIVPQVTGGSAPRALSANPQPAKGKPTILTMKVTEQNGAEPLTKAQEDRKRLAALYYLSATEAESQGLHLSMTAFAASMDTNKVRVSRSCAEFPLAEIKNDIEAYRQDMRKTG